MKLRIPLPLGLAYFFISPSWGSLLIAVIKRLRVGVSCFFRIYDLEQAFTSEIKEEHFWGGNVSEV